MKLGGVVLAFADGAVRGANSTRTLGIAGDVLCSCDAAIACRLPDGSLLVRWDARGLGGVRTQRLVRRHLRELVRVLDSVSCRHRLVDDLFPEVTARAALIRRALGV